MVMSTMMPVLNELAISAGSRRVVPRCTFRNDLAVQNALQQVTTGEPAAAAAELDDGGQHVSHCRGVGIRVRQWFPMRA